MPLIWEEAAACKTIRRRSAWRPIFRAATIDKPINRTRIPALFLAGSAIWAVGIALGSSEPALSVVLATLGLLTICKAVFDLAIYKAQVQAGDDQPADPDWLMIVLLLIAVAVSVSLAGLAIGHGAFGPSTRIAFGIGAVAFGGLIAPLAMNRVAPSRTG